MPDGQVGKIESFIREGGDPDQIPDQDWSAAGLDPALKTKVSSFLREGGDPTTITLADSEPSTSVLSKMGEGDGLRREEGPPSLPVAEYFRQDPYERTDPSYSTARRHRRTEAINKANQVGPGTWLMNEIQEAGKKYSPLGIAGTALDEYVDKQTAAIDRSPHGFSNPRIVAEAGLRTLRDVGKGIGKHTGLAVAENVGHALDAVAAGKGDEAAAAGIMAGGAAAFAPFGAARGAMPDRIGNFPVGEVFDIPFQKFNEIVSAPLGEKSGYRTIEAISDLVFMDLALKGTAKGLSKLKGKKGSATPAPAESKSVLGPLLQAMMPNKGSMELVDLVSAPRSTQAIAPGSAALTGESPAVSATRDYSVRNKKSGKGRPIFQDPGPSRSVGADVPVQPGKPAATGKDGLFTVTLGGRTLGVLSQKGDVSVSMHGDKYGVFMPEATDGPRTGQPQLIGRFNTQAEAESFASIVAGQSALNKIRSLDQAKVDVVEAIRTKNEADAAQQARQREFERQQAILTLQKNKPVPTPPLVPPGMNLATMEGVTAKPGAKGAQKGRVPKVVVPPPGMGAPTPAGPAPVDPVLAAYGGGSPPPAVSTPPRPSILPAKGPGKPQVASGEPTPTQTPPEAPVATESPVAQNTGVQAKPSLMPQETPGETQVSGRQELIDRLVHARGEQEAGKKSKSVVEGSEVKPEEIVEVSPEDVASITKFVESMSSEDYNQIAKQYGLPPLENKQVSQAKSTEQRWLKLAAKGFPWDQATSNAPAGTPDWMNPRKLAAPARAKLYEAVLKGDLKPEHMEEAWKTFEERRKADLGTKKAAKGKSVTTSMFGAQGPERGQSGGFDITPHVDRTVQWIKDKVEGIFHEGGTGITISKHRIETDPHVIRDPDGNPVPFYHGTTKSPFESFDPNKKGENTGARSAKAAFFVTKNPVTAAAEYYMGRPRITFDANRFADLLYSMGIKKGVRASNYEAANNMHEAFRFSAEELDDLKTGADFIRWTKSRGIEPGAYVDMLINNYGIDLFEQAGIKKDYLRPGNVGAIVDVLENLAAKIRTAKEASSTNAYENPSHLRKSFISAENPYIQDMKGQNYGAVHGGTGRLIQEKFAAGHDAVIFTNYRDGGPPDTVIAFRYPEQEILWNHKSLEGVPGNMEAVKRFAEWIRPEPSITAEKKVQYLEPAEPRSPYHIWEEKHHRLITEKNAAVKAAQAALDAWGAIRIGPTESPQDFLRRVEEARRVFELADLREQEAREAWSKSLDERPISPFSGGETRGTGVRTVIEPTISSPKPSSTVTMSMFGGGQFGEMLKKGGKAAAEAIKNMPEFDVMNSTKKLGKAGRELAQKWTTVNSTSARLYNPAENAVLRAFDGASKEDRTWINDYANFRDLRSGKVKAPTPGVSAINDAITEQIAALDATNRRANKFIFDEGSRFGRLSNIPADKYYPSGYTPEIVELLRGGDAKTVAEFHKWNPEFGGRNPFKRGEDTKPFSLNLGRHMDAAEIAKTADLKGPKEWFPPNTEEVILQHLRDGYRSAAEHEVFQYNNPDGTRNGNQGLRGKLVAQIQHEFPGNSDWIYKADQRLARTTWRDRPHSERIARPVLRGLMGATSTALMGGRITQLPKQWLSVLPNIAATSGSRVAAQALVETLVSPKIRLAQSYLSGARNRVSRFAETHGLDMPGRTFGRLRKFQHQAFGPLVGGDALSRATAFSAASPAALDVVASIKAGGKNKDYALRKLDRLHMEDAEIARFENGTQTTADIAKYEQLYTQRHAIVTDVGRMPLFGSHPLANSLLYLKKFMVGQMNFTSGEIVQELGRGNWTPAARALLWSVAIGELQNAMIDPITPDNPFRDDIKDIIRKGDVKAAVYRILDDLATTAFYGFAGQALLRFGKAGTNDARDRPMEVANDTLGFAPAELGDKLVQSVQKEGLTLDAAQDFFSKRIPAVREAVEAWTAAQKAIDLTGNTGVEQAPSSGTIQRPSIQPKRIPKKSWEIR